MDAIFEAASKYGMRLIAGKVLMDKNCPEELRDTPETGYKQSRQLIEKWHGRDRLSYAMTLRFAITSSEEQLRQAGRLLKEYPEVYLQTHLAENEEEVAQVARQFPWSRSYLDVYEHFGLVRERSVFAHCIHMEDDDRKLMARKGAAMAFCPSSNLLLGSGLFDLQAARRCKVSVGAGSDVGGGTNLSMLRTVADGYNVGQLLGHPITPLDGLYLATLGVASMLHLDGAIGNLAKGKEADLAVLNPSRIETLRRRWQGEQDIADMPLPIVFLGEQWIVQEKWIMGKRWVSDEMQ